MRTKVLVSMLLFTPVVLCAAPPYKPAPKKQVPQRQVYQPAPVPREEASMYPSTSPETKNTITGYLGLAIPTSDIDLTKLHAGKDKLGTVGVGVGAQYLYNPISRLGFGAEINYNAFGDKASTVLIPGYRTISSATSLVCLGLAKFHVIKDGPVRPYLLGGLGVHRTSLEVVARPVPGNVWFNGGTDQRSLVDKNTAYSIALALGIGLDIPIGDRFFVGAEGRYQYLGDAKYDTTRNAVRAFGISSVTGSASMVNLLAKAGMKF